MNHKNEPTQKCSIELRKLPLERFKLPKDNGNPKWKSAARSRRLILEFIASFANGDGTVGKYSPGMAWQSEYSGFYRGWIRRLHDDLRELGFLDWSRDRKENRRQRKYYTITIPAEKADLEGSMVSLESPCTMVSPETPYHGEYSGDHGESRDTLSCSLQSHHIRHQSASFPSSIPSNNLGEKNDRQDTAADASEAKAKPTSMGVQEKQSIDPHDVLEKIDRLYKDRTGYDFKLWEEERYDKFYTRQVRKHGEDFVLAVVELFAEGDEDHAGMNCPAGVLMARWGDYGESVHEAAGVAAGGAQ